MSWNWTWMQFKCKRLSEFETQLSYPTFSTTWTSNIPVPWQSLAVTPIDSENVGWFSFGKTWNVSTSQWVTTLWSCESPPNTLGTKCDTLKVSEHLFHSHILASFSNLIQNMSTVKHYASERETDVAQEELHYSLYLGQLLVTYPYLSTSCSSFQPYLPSVPAWAQSVISIYSF